MELTNFQINVVSFGGQHLRAGQLLIWGCCVSVSDMRLMVSCLVNHQQKQVYFPTGLPFKVDFPISSFNNFM